MMRKASICREFVIVRLFARFSRCNQFHKGELILHTNFQNKYFRPDMTVDDVVLAQV